MSLIKIPVNFDGAPDPDKNMWEIFPPLKYYPPYGHLYDQDDSSGKEYSSRQMWCIFFYNDPDEDLNPFFRNSPKERKAKILEIYGALINWDDELFQECLKAYPDDCMSLVKKALALEKDKLIERAELIRSTPMTFDKFDEKGKPIKGTALQINTLQKDSSKAYEAYKKAEDLFKEERESTQRVYGGGAVPITDRTDNFF